MATAAPGEGKGNPHCLTGLIAPHLHLPQQGTGGTRASDHPPGPLSLSPEECHEPHFSQGCLFFGLVTGLLPPPPPAPSWARP